MNTSRSLHCPPADDSLLAHHLLSADRQHRGRHDRHADLRAAAAGRPFMFIREGSHTRLHCEARSLASGQAAATGFQGFKRFSSGNRHGSSSCQAMAADMWLLRLWTSSFW